MADVKEIIEKLSKESGVKAVIIVSNEGFAISVASEDSKIDADAIAAVVMMGEKALKSIGEELSLNDLKMASYEYEKGTILVRRINPDAMLAVLTEPKAPIGSLRFLTKRRIEDLAKLLQ